MGTGNTLNGQSGMYANVSTMATTATLPFRIIRLFSDQGVGPGTEAGAYNKIVVQANIYQETGI